ncbi:MAG: SDR family NAD(P)-dependent oxidoreductase [Burkholderiales bacterium]
MRLKNRIAVVTGGNTGIGRGVALAFAAEGADIALGWINRERDAATLVEEINSMGRRAQAVRCDVTREADVVNLFAATEGMLGAIDILVDNAGVQLSRALVDMSLDDWDRVLDVNLRGVFLCSREAARRMIPRQRGRIINTCSQLGHLGRERYSAYSASKGGLISFTRALARELAPHGILVNGVGPGLIDTGFDPLPDEAKQRIAASLPLQRLGTLGDVAPAYVFLASDEAQFFCGQVIHPNGGQVMY